MYLQILTNHKNTSMRKTYSIENNELLHREIKMFSADSFGTDGDGQSSGSITTGIKSDLAAWSSRRSFSQASLQIRLTEARKNLRERMVRIHRDYKTYAENKLKPADLDNFVAILNNDLLLLITTAADSIETGQSLTSLLGLSKYGREIKIASQKFTIAYRKSLRQLDSTGSVTPAVYKSVDESLNILINEIHKSILGDNYVSDTNPISL